MEIKINNLNWKPDKSKEPVLKDISITLKSGGIIGLLGPNGAGKTSLVRHILGLVRPQKGEILFDGRNINEIKRDEMARIVSFLPQTIGANVNFSVFDVVAMGREPHRKSFTPLDGEDMRIIQEAMEFTNCWQLRDKSVSHISGGERQRVMIARTIAQDTPWIVLDEPVSNLDIKHQIELMKVLESLVKEKKKTVIAILHDINLASRFCDKLVFMKAGNICVSGCRDQVMNLENLNMIYGIEFQHIESMVIPKY